MADFNPKNSIDLSSTGITVPVSTLNKIGEQDGSLTWNGIVFTGGGGASTWEELGNKPTSTVEQIDAAVTALHSHTNKSVIDLISMQDNAPLWNGAAWPGGSGGTADSIDWTNITGKPTASVTDIDNSVLAVHSHINKSLIDKIGVYNGDPTWDGSPWPGGTGTASSIEWANITNKPASIITNIDEAVSYRHLHYNSTSLNKISELSGAPTWNGEPWPSTATVIDWSNITNKPTSTTTQIDQAVTNSHSTHEISTITGLPTALSLKSDSSHTHTGLHVHDNKVLLDEYTYTNAQIGDSISKIHNHTNSVLLNKLTVDGSDNLLYNNKALGNMFKSVYDTDNDNVVEAADTLTGLTATISELNYVAGATSNIQGQLNALSNVTNYSGPAATYADIATMYPTPSTSDMVIVIADENHSNSSSMYIYNGSSWTYAGPFTAQVRDFAVNPISLTTEVTGILPAANIDSNILRPSSFTHTLVDIDLSVTNSHIHDNKALLDSYSIPNSSLATTVSNSHTHTNSVALSNIAIGTSNEPKWNGYPWPSGDMQFYMTTEDLPATGESNKLYAIYSDTIQNSVSALYIWKDGAYSLISGVERHIEVENIPVGTYLNQETIYDVTLGDSGAAISSSNPKTITLPIANTSTYKIPKLEVLKFVAGATSTNTLFDFSSSDSSKFANLDNFTLDGVLKPKTTWIYTPTTEITYEDSKIRTVTFDATQFVDITSINM